ncbi:MAG TPA: geranylgeranylglycerol-phosphate geranylgeranyltransferase [Bacteroidales bacterium]|nr:geranylgeranylglycerol-phosphate geranylgeranyltransferase [Bacteroidales bacterium]
MLKALFKLIRIENLLIIAATQYVMRWCIISPFLGLNHFSLQLDWLHFLILVLSTVFIAAAGYIINDYFDTRTDRLNKPGRVVIDREIPRRTAILLHTVFNVAGVGLGVYLSFYIKVPGLSLIFLIASGFLWFYSTNYKRQFLVGNLMVSFLTASVPLLVVLFELPLLNREYGPIMMRHQVNFNYLFNWIAGFAFFAFITTLIREIIKDTEDFEGDSAYGMNTLPIIIGTKYTRIVLVSLITLLIAALLWVVLKFIIFSGVGIDYLSAGYFLFLLIVPSLVLIYYIIRAGDKHDFHKASQVTKLIMLAGIMYAFLVRYIVLNQLN